MMLKKSEERQGSLSKPQHTGVLVCFAIIVVPLAVSFASR